MRALPAWRRRSAASRRRGAADRQGRQGDHLRRRAEPRLQRRPDATAVQPAHAVEGALARARRGRRSTRRRRRRSTSRRRHDRRRRPRARSSSSRSPGSSSSASVDSIGGATLAGFDLPTAQQLFDKRGQARPDPVAAQAGRLAAEARRRRSSRCCRRPTQVRTGDAAGEARTRRTRTGSSRSSQYFLLAFGGIALFVGAFVIANSLSITIAQRTRELATLRTLGASRRQVLRSVLLEALVIGRARLGGRALPRPRAREGPGRALRRGRVHLPNSGLVFETRTIVVSLAARHRRHAARELCAGAPRDARAADRGRARGRDAAAGALRALPDAVRALVLDRARRSRCSLLGLFVGDLATTTRADPRSASARCCSSSAWRCSSAPLVRPLAGRARLARRRGSAAPPGALARDNATRNPQRTASTAAALMIGLALVTLVAMLAAGITHDVRGAVERALHAPTTRSPRRTTSRRSRSRRRSAAQGAGVDAVGERARAARRKAFGKRIGVDRPSTPDIEQCDRRSTGRRARSDVLATLGATARSSTTATRRTTTCTSARRSRSRSPTGAKTDARRSKGSSTRRPAARRSAT